MKAYIGAKLLDAAESKPNGAPFEIRDVDLPGFILRVQPSGVRSFIAQLGRGRRVTIGKVGHFKADEARERCKKILGNVAHGRPPLEGIAGASVLTLGEFIEDTYKPWYSAHYPKHADAVFGRIKCHFGKWFSDPLTTITEARIEDWCTSRVAAGAAASTIRRDLGALGRVLTQAVKRKRIAASPMPHVERPKIDANPAPRFLHDAEETRLRKVLKTRDAELRKARASANAWRKERHRELLPTLPHYGDHLTPAVLVSLNTGLRRGELLALRWEDVDLRAGRLTVRGTTAKSGDTRHVDLNSEAVAVLKKWKAQAPDAARVFPFTVGFRKSWLAVLERAHIADCRWHDLRHTFASRLVQRGVNINEVRDLMGHGSIQLTLRYAHLAPDNRRKAVQKLVRA